MVTDERPDYDREKGPKAKRIGLQSFLENGVVGKGKG